MNRRKALIAAACLVGFIGFALLILGTYDSQPAHKSAPALTFGHTGDVAAAEAAIAELGRFLTALQTPPSKPAPPAPRSQPRVGGDVWDDLAQCEAGGNWQTNTGNGFGGGLQFMHQSSYSTWLAFGGAEYAPHPWEASKEQQIQIAERVLARSGWGAWPACSRKLGLR